MLIGPPGWWLTSGVDYFMPDHFGANVAHEGVELVIDQVGLESIHERCVDPVVIIMLDKEAALVKVDRFLKMDVIPCALMQAFVNGTAQSKKWTADRILRGYSQPPSIMNTHEVYELKT